MGLKLKTLGELLAVATETEAALKDHEKREGWSTIRRGESSKSRKGLLRVVNLIFPVFLGIMKDILGLGLPFHFLTSLVITYSKEIKPQPTSKRRDLRPTFK